MKKKWTLKQALKLFKLPFLELLYKAQTIHKKNFKANSVQVSTLLSIKTGACPENCSYCPQSAHYKTQLKPELLMELADVIAHARRAKAAGSSRFCMGAAWRGPKEPDLEKVCKMVEEVKKLGLETCVTLGLLKNGQAEKLKKAGLDFYNHNIDSSAEFYKQIITTRKFEDRLNTLELVQEAGINVCAGGILGMGETNEDRIKMLVVLANLTEAPKSVPINKLIRIQGTPLASEEEIDPFDYVRIVAIARIMMPKSYVRLSAGREEMSDELQALCFMGGANSIFYGEKLLTAVNPIPKQDDLLFTRLGLEKM